MANAAPGNITCRHEPEPSVRTTATNGTAETPTAATATTATTAPGADENYDSPYDEHKYVNKKKKNDNNIESKKSHDMSEL